MKTFKYLFVCAFLLAASVCNASIITGHFSQDGFDGGGTITGYFKGQDFDGDGQIRTVRFFSNFLNPALPLIDEVLYAEITFSGFATSQGDHTIVFDGAIAASNPFYRPFFSLAYNVGSREIGDEENEGMSFSIFAPSTNYVMGELFDFLILPDIDLTSPVANTWGSCNGINVCGAVVEFIPGAVPNTIETVFQSLSKSSVSVVSEPTALSFFLLTIACVAFKRRSSNQ